MPLKSSACFRQNRADSCWRVIQMSLRRKVDAFLEEWKADKNRKPLIVKGSRQIGKTESILHFAADHYENVIEINFVRDEKYKGILTLIPSYKKQQLIFPAKNTSHGEKYFFMFSVLQGVYPNRRTLLIGELYLGNFLLKCSRKSSLGQNVFTHFSFMKRKMSLLLSS